MKSNYSFLAFALIGIFLLNISLTSALDFDNKLTYENNDLKVEFDNSFLGITTSHIGEAELKSHNSTAQILKVAPGENRAVMYYDFNFSEEYENGLGVVDFIDMRTGETINKDYHFVIWGEKEIEKNKYSIECEEVYNSTNKSNSTICQQIITGTYTETEEGWVNFNTSNIPNGISRIGLVTDVELKDYIDGVWTIVGKKVDKHASWTADLNVDIVSYYKLDETSGLTAYDSLYLNNGTTSGSVTVGVQGKINNSYYFSGGKVDIGSSSSLDINPLTDDITICAWINTTDTEGMIISRDGGTASTAQYRIFFASSGHIWADYGNGGTVASALMYNDGNWHLACMIGVGGGGAVTLYVDNVSVGTPQVSGTNLYSGNTVIGDRDTSSYPLSPANIDEVSIWNRTLSIEQLSNIWNNGNGATYTDQFGATITLYQPEDYYNSTDPNITFIAGISDVTPLNVSLYINGILNETNTSGYLTNYTFNKNFTDGDYNWTIEACVADSCSTSTRYFNVNTTPFINYTDPTPANNSNLSTTYIPVNVTLTETYFENVTFNFYKGGVLNETVTFTNSTRFYNKTSCTCDNWQVNVTTCTTTGQCNSTETRTFIIDILPPTINNITSPSGVYDLLFDGYDLDLEYNITDNLIGLDSCWIDYGKAGYLEQSQIPTPYLQANYSFDIEEITNQSYLKIKRQEDYESATNITYYFNVSECSTTNITATSYCSGIISVTCDNNFTCGGDLIGSVQTFANAISQQIKITQVDIFKGYPNVSINCSENSTSIKYVEDVNNLTVYANDSLSNQGNETTSWNYKILEINQSFNNETTEGSLETFLATLKVGTGYTITEAVIFNYNSSSEIGQSFKSGLYTILRKADFLIPNVESDTNSSFYWSLTLSDSTKINLTKYNQTIYKLSLDNCSNFTNQLLNLTVLEEELQTLLPNATIEIAVNIYDTNREENILNISNQYEKINPLGICLNRNITEGINYSLDATIKYSDTSYAKEYYNIINSQINSESETQNINLYDLNSSDSTEFQLTFTGSDFLPVENALVYVDRQYINENRFKTVELPKTDYNGQTVLHLVRNDIIYNIVITKDGVVLGNFENLVAFCDDYTIGDCNIELNAFDSVEGVFEYNEALGIVFQAPTYNETENEVTFNFITSDGSAKEVLLEVTRNDIFGNRSVCNSSIVSSGATLTCDISPTIDDSQLNTNIYVNNILSVKSTVDLDSTDYGESGYFISFVFMFSIILFFVRSKEGVLISMGLAVASTIGLGLQSGNMTGLGASGLWLIIIILVGIYKLNKDRQQ